MLTNQTDSAISKASKLIKKGELEEAKNIIRENNNNNFSDYNTLNTMGILKSNDSKSLENVVNLIKSSYILIKV